MRAIHLADERRRRLPLAPGGAIRGEAGAVTPASYHCNLCCSIVGARQIVRHFGEFHPTLAAKWRNCVRDIVEVAVGGGVR